MIPSMAGLMSGSAGDDSSLRLKKFMYMMDSMTDAELDGQVDLEKFPKRIERIARGSGVQPQEVIALLKAHKQFEGMIKKMGKSGMMKGSDKDMAKKMQRNPTQAMSQIRKTMDPRIIQQMGGAENVMSMMKEMGDDGKGGGGGMSGQLAQLMGGAGM